MFYIITDNGINISEAGRSPLFINKEHEEYQNIKDNIKALSYNEILNMIDLKSKIVGYVNEKTETYFNEDGDLEMKVDFNNSAYDLVSLAKHQITDGRYEKDLTEKEEYLLKLLNNDSLHLVGVKLIFE
jgi:hypothetical protein